MGGPAGLVLIGRLTGLVLLSDPGQVAPAGLPARRAVEASGLPLVASCGLAPRLEARLGRPLTQAGRDEIVAEILSCYRSNGRPFVQVLTPPQDVTNGMLQLVVLEAKLGAVRVEGSRWLRARRTRAKIRLGPGEAIDVRKLEEDLEWIERNAFRRVEPVFTPGAAPGTTDLELRQTDRFPLRPFAGYEDTGTELTDEDRLFAGLTWGDAFGLDGQLDYQMSADPGLRLFKAHGAAYSQPLPWRHVLTLSGSYAATRADVPAPFELSGHNEQASARYAVPLARRGAFRHGVEAGFDYKRADNNLAFGGESVFGAPVETLQWTVGYDASLRDRLGASTLRATGVFSPGAWTALNTDAAHEQTRSGATARYLYARLELGRTTGLPWDLVLVNQLTGQWSSANLLAGEQLGFGGYGSVRGYDSRVVNADQGLLLSAELRAPGLGEALQLLAFVDGGLAVNKRLLPGESRSTALLGAGPGLRLALGSRLALRADYAWRLRRLADDSGPARRWHLSAAVRW